MVSFLSNCSEMFTPMFVTITCGTTGLPLGSKATKPAGSRLAMTVRSLIAVAFGKYAGTGYVSVTATLATYLPPMAALTAARIRWTSPTICSVVEWPKPS